MANITKIPSDAELMLRVEKAQWWSLSNQPFFGSLALGLVNVLGNPYGTTACTDGRRIYWDREFLGKLSDEETRFVLLHETLHPALGHLWRFPEPSDAANMACDYAINGRLVKIDGLKMPAGALQDKAYDDLAEEEILNRLGKNPNGNQAGQCSPDPCGDYTQPDEGGSKGDSGQNKAGKSPNGGQNTPQGQNGPKNAGNSLKEEWERRLIQAVQAAKALQRGDCPADLQRVIDRTLNQRVDWKRETADFIKDRIASRNDWSRSSRRMAYQPVIYPRKRREDTGLVVFVRDTSGSVSDEMIAEFNGLIESCLGECNCRGLVMDCDAALHAEHEVGAGECVPDKAIGGGGTCFDPPFARVCELQEKGERIAGLVYLTDLCGSFSNDKSLEYPPTLWLSTTDQIGPMGRTVKIET